ncbi:MAG: SDR family oxidoreductase [Verrucomicrobiota bacterium]
MNTLITGCSRGIGLALTHVLLSKWHQVIATARQPESCSSLQTLKEEFPETLYLESLDVTDPESIASCFKRLEDHGIQLDTLINNAAVFADIPESTIEDLSAEAFRLTLETNLLGPMQVIQTFLPLLKGSSNPRVVNISSGAGSISGFMDLPYYSYGASKAALNHFTRTLASDLEPEGICVVAISPGWVRTEMGGDNAELSPEESATALANTIDQLSLSDTDSFMGRNGSTEGYAW